MLATAINIQYFNSLLLNFATIALQTSKNYNRTWQCNTITNNSKCM